MPPLPDRMTARGLAVLYSTRPYLRRLHDWYAATDSPSYVPVRWLVANNPAKSVLDWNEFKGSADTRRQQQVGILCLDRVKLDGLNEVHQGGEHAVGLEIGRLPPVVAVLPYGFGCEGLDDDYLAAIRIGRGTLRVTAGLWLADSKQLIVPEGGVTTRPDTVRVADLPEYVPLV